MLAVLLSGDVDIHLRAAEFADALATSTAARREDADDDRDPPRPPDHP